VRKRRRGCLPPHPFVKNPEKVRTEGDRNIATNFRIWATDRLCEYIIKDPRSLSDFRIILDRATDMFVLTFVLTFVSIISASPRVGFSSAGLFVVMEGYNV